MKHHKTQHQIGSGLWVSVALSCALIAVWASSTIAQSAAQATIAPNEATINMGQTTEMAVQVENITGLYGAEIVITFDPNLLEVVDADPDRPGTQITPGDFLSGGMNETNDVANGRIAYVMQLAPPLTPANGGGVLARITFKGIGSGQTNIALDDLFLSDKNNNGIGCRFTGAQITVQAGNIDGSTPMPMPPTPIPATPMPIPSTPLLPTPTAMPPTPILQATVAVQPITAASGGVNCAVVQGYHIVQRGETLYAIARAYATNPYAIGACNPTINPRRIHASNHLAIPYAPWTPPPGPTAVRQFGPNLIPAPVPTPAPGCRALHTVQAGETLTAIGLKYNANIWDIARANRIYNLHLINAGQVLCIP